MLVKGNQCVYVMGPLLSTLEEIYVGKLKSEQRQ